jgi:hypothetical protein
MHVVCLLGGLHNLRVKRYWSMYTTLSLIKKSARLIEPWWRYLKRLFNFFHIFDCIFSLIIFNDYDFKKNHLSYLSKTSIRNRFLLFENAIFSIGDILSNYFSWKILKLSSRVKFYIQYVLIYTKTTEWNHFSIILNWIFIFNLRKCLSMKKLFTQETH